MSWAAEQLRGRDGAQWELVGLVGRLHARALEGEDSALEAGGVDADLDSLLTGAHVVVLVVETVVIGDLLDFNWLVLELLLQTVSLQREVDQS